MLAVARFFEAVSKGVNRIALYGAVAAVLVMTFSAAYQVVARYIFDAPPVWTEEVARRAMVWAGMLGASVAFREKLDPTLFPGSARLAGAAGDLFALIRAVGVIVFAFPVVYYCLFGPHMSFARGFLGRNLERTSEMLNVSMIWFVAAVPIAFVFILIHVVAGVATHIAGVTQELDAEPIEREESPA